MRLKRRDFIKGTTALGAAAGVGLPYLLPSMEARAQGSPIRVGVLFSLTGGLSIIEKSLSDATLMAISEINAKGGVKGMKIEPIIEDGASDPKTYNEKASKLVIQNRVPTVFGSYTSASRKAVLPVFERRNNLYFYPTLRPQLSTRIGTAVRHAGVELSGCRSHRRVLLLVSDGEPFDIDVDDADYLVEDARRAVLGLRASGIDTFCLGLSANGDEAGVRIFGRANYIRARHLEELPEQLSTFYFRLSVR